MKDAKFYRCPICGNLVGMIHSSGVKMVCCGKPMEALIPGTVEASAEKHLPVLDVKGRDVAVRVGSVTHPMSEEHSIEWIYLLTDRGGHRRALSATDAPEATFTLSGNETLLGAYAYCNLHGLWMTEA